MYAQYQSDDKLKFVTKSKEFGLKYTYRSLEICFYLKFLSYQLNINTFILLTSTY